MLLAMEKYPKSAGMVTAPINDILFSATFPPIREAFAQAGLLEGRDWDFNFQRREFSLYNGSIAYFRSTDDADTLRGPSIMWAWMDEYQDSSEKAFGALAARIRQQEYPHLCWLTGTPKGKQHWSRKIFLPKAYSKEFDEAVFDREEGIYITYNAPTKDNPYGGAKLHATLAGIYGENTPLARQELYGEEVMVDTLRFDVWDRQMFVKPRDQWPQPYPDRVVAGVDFGFSHPSAILVEGLDEKNRRYILETFSQQHMSEGDLTEVATDMYHRHPIRYFLCDSADPRWVRTMARAGLPVKYAKKSLGATNEPSSGFGLCYSALTRRVEGQPAFFVDPVNAKHFVREIEAMSDEKGKNQPYALEKPKNQRDDIISCWRYAEMGIYRMWVRPPAKMKQLNINIVVGA